jgi:8-oxo-dGTP pyrophosphatase MutT (NUDIX family)
LNLASLDTTKLQFQLLKQLPGLAAQLRMAPPVRQKIARYDANVKLGGVLVLLYPKSNIWHLLLMQRTADGGTHSGQISFPGGKYDASDGTITYTAIRECYEEMGIAQHQYRVLGNLTPLYIPPSNFLVTPTLAIAHARPNLIPNRSEVNEVIEVPLHELFANKTEAEVMRSDNKTLSMRAPVYVLADGRYIWGATAMMLSELEVLVGM